MQYSALMAIASGHPQGDAPTFWLLRQISTTQENKSLSKDLKF
jgi:hypothetical protein